LKSREAIPLTAGTGRRAPLAQVPREETYGQADKVNGGSIKGTELQNV